jgi:hypothetical protein
MLRYSQFSGRRKKDKRASSYTKPSYSDSACGVQGKVSDIERYVHTHLDDRWILLASLHELFICQLRVLIPVHVLENFVYALRKEC